MKRKNLHQLPTTRPGPLATAVNDDDSTEPTADAGSKPVSLDLTSSEYYANRELSHLQFNLRVLEEAKNPEHPLLERLMFLLIFSSNLDEFYEIRVSGLKKQLDSGRQRPGPDGKYPEQVLESIHARVHQALEEQYQITESRLAANYAATEYSYP